MTNARRMLGLLVLLSSLVAAAAHAIKVQIREGTMTGRVFDSSNNQGLPGLTVKLVSPPAAHRPEKVTRTDWNGQFRFADIDKGRYLLEVFHGVMLLYRRTVDTSVNSEFEVVLKRAQE